MHVLCKCQCKAVKWTEKLIQRLSAPQKIFHRNNWPIRSMSNLGPGRPPWKVLFFGSDKFAVESLKSLYESQRNNLISHLEIVTAYKGTRNEVTCFAESNNIEIHKWPLCKLPATFDIGVVVSFGHLIPRRIIDAFPLGMINVHGSLLPRWRGAAPISWALMHGDTYTGVSIMKIKPHKFDIGEVIAQERTDISSQETYPELYKKIAKLGANLLLNVIHQLPDILNNAVPQNEDTVSYAPRITQETSFIKWDEMTARDVYNLERALLTVEPLRTCLNEQVIKLFGIEMVPSEIVACSKSEIPGLVIFEKNHSVLHVQCKDNTWVSVNKIVIPGRKPMNPVDFGSGFVNNRPEKYCKFVYKNKIPLRLKEFDKDAFLKRNKSLQT